MERRKFLKLTTSAIAASGLSGSSHLEAIALEKQSINGPVIDLRNAVVVIRPGELSEAERTAASVLVSEIARRTGIRLETSTVWPKFRTPIVITASGVPSPWQRKIPLRAVERLPEKRKEGYLLFVETGPHPPATLWIIGSDARGMLFGVGHLLRKLDWGPGTLTVSASLDIATAPQYPIRGHQLGYRAQANSYDAWDATQFETYIRELTFFGVNSIEGIPFQDDRKTPVMRFPRRQMNREIGAICYRYGLDYWAWIPAVFDLKDAAKSKQLLDQCEELFGDTRTFTGVSFPGGDPGDNPPELVFPFLEEMAARLRPHHPKARIWFSLQDFSTEHAEYSYKWIEQHQPDWLGGLFAGPSSPPHEEMRSRLPGKYGLRLYPDITHNKLAQYELQDWDQAYSLTEGREAINPRAVEFSNIFSQCAEYSDGFISYSDGIHDDVNKTVWSALSWDPSQDVGTILEEYSRVYFEPRIAKQASDGILGLEKNWQGPLPTNGAVEATLLQWESLQAKAPGLETNWRWQMCLLRANYDAYVRHRLIHETGLERECNAVLNHAPSMGSEAAMVQASVVLNTVTTQPVSPQLRARIVDLCARLFHAIGLQSSVEKYFAIDEQRGAVLDFVDYPLNNRWWLEDQFAEIRRLNVETAKLERLHRLATWEQPGPGSFYDCVGDLNKSPHVVRCGLDPGKPTQLKDVGPTFWWWDHGMSRARLTWQVTMWPVAIVYEALDPDAKYVVRSSGYGQSLLRIEGELIQPTLNGRKMGEFKEFPVPDKYVRKRRITLTWDLPADESNLNWRDTSRLAEVWLLKQS